VARRFPERAIAILHAATTHIRILLRSAHRDPPNRFLFRVGDHLRIAPGLISCDLWRFQGALAAAASPTMTAMRRRRWRKPSPCAGGPPDGMDALWIEEHREALRAATWSTRSPNSPICAEHYDPDAPCPSLIAPSRSPGTRIRVPADHAAPV